MPRQRILLVDDHVLVRLGLKALIERSPAMEVVGEAASAPEAVAKSLSFRPDVVILDIRLGGNTNGIDACRQIKAQLPETNVIMLTSSAEDETMFAAIRAGATGYVLKQSGGCEIVRAIENAAEGKSLLDPAVTRSVFDKVRRAAEADVTSAFADLSRQEQRVLARVTCGDTNRDIAVTLHLGEGTVRNYVSNILRKLGVANRAEAAAYATRFKLADLAYADLALGI